MRYITFTDLAETLSFLYPSFELAGSFWQSLTEVVLYVRTQHLSEVLLSREERYSHQLWQIVSIWTSMCDVHIAFHWCLWITCDRYAIYCTMVQRRSKRVLLFGDRALNVHSLQLMLLRHWYAKSPSAWHRPNQGWRTAENGPRLLMRFRGSKTLPLLQCGQPWYNGNIHWGPWCSAAAAFFN